MARFEVREVLGGRALVWEDGRLEGDPEAMQEAAELVATSAWVSVTPTGPTVIASVEEPVAAYATMLASLEGPCAATGDVPELDDEVPEGATP